MKIQKGNVVMIALIVTVVMITVGVIGWMFTKRVANPVTSTPVVQETVVEKNNVSLPEQQIPAGFQRPSYIATTGVIAMVIKKETYDSLSAEIEQWSEDVKKEGVERVEILKYENNVNKEQIKKDLKDLYTTKKLKGVVLVGNVPVAKSGYRCTSFPSFSNPCLDYKPSGGEQDPFTEQNLQPDDYYYVDINNECKRNEKADAFYYDSCQKASDQDPFWISRITSPIHNDLIVSNQLLKTYFNRNHEFRVGKLSFQKKLLVYAPINGSQGYTKNEDNSNKETQAFLSAVTSDTVSPYTNNVKYLNYNATDSDFFNELKSGYEYVQYNGHGTPVFQENSITYDRVVENAPKSLMYEFASCSVGRYTDEKYLAGAYLFQSEALIVLAAQMPMLATMQPSSNLQFFLASGMQVGDASQMADIGALEVLGDGTLKLRKKEVVKVRPEIFIDQKEMDLGKLVFGKDIDKKYIFKIKNGGKAPLIVKMDVNPSKTYPLNGASFAISEVDKEFVLGPNEQKEIPFNVNSGGYLIEKGPYFGAYSGFFSILSNDPDNSVVKIPYKGEITK